MWLKLGLIIFLIPLVWEDLNSRQVSLIWLLLLSLIFLMFCVFYPIFNFWQDLLLNSAFLFVQFLLLSGYFSLKYKKWIWVTKIGLGGADVFFLISLCLFFPFINYFLFFLTSLIWTLILSLLFVLFSDRKIIKLPLAGLQALLLGFLIILGLKYKFDIRSESWLIYLYE
jgi:hypothetical protein